MEREVFVDTGDFTLLTSSFPFDSDWSVAQKSAIMNFIEGG
jgi:hypothetical protein